MKRFFKYLKGKPVALISLIIICIFYFVMIFADFFAPYPSVVTHAENSFHPANIQMTKHGLVAREYRVIDKTSFKYAKVKGHEYKIKFFVHGEEYKILGLIPGNIRLFGTEPDSNGKSYPVYLMGADNLGRDLFSRIVYGSRISLTIGFVASAISLALAVLLGGLAGFYGGKTDWTIMRFAEFFMLIPSLYFILFLRSLLNTKMDSGTSYMLITLILSLVGWPGSARTLRGIVHSIKHEDYILNAKNEGIPSTIIIFTYIIPQMASLLIVSTTLSIPGFIMSETTLSYLGLGITDPAVSWGSLINRDISTISNLKKFPWLLNPVWMLLIVTLAFNFVGDALRDFFDPYHVVYKKHNLKKLFTKKIKETNKTNIDDKALLEIKNLNVIFHMIKGTEKSKFHAVKNVSYKLYKGEILGIVGESGSGKSVSSTAIPSLLPENAEVTGQILYEGKDLLTLNHKEIREYRGKKIGYIFQEPGRSFDPLQNIGNAFLETFKNSNPNISKEEALKKAEALLSEVGIPDPESRLKNFPHQFSGGQLQRIGIALALAQDCELVIADEPTTALDVTIQAQIVSLLLRLKEERNLSVIFISHNINLVSEISDRILVMYRGCVVETGTAKNVMTNAVHPYTKALIASVPEFGTHYTKEKMAFISDEMRDTFPLSGENNE
ncbi:MAG: dipeptide/oligopeptide/nickel ABC transporter permease/ATP-binding protein [Treponema sp.]|nr:dipeptide/oligopeptide/nickel ABC transporter permease/ATP-binding protein [Treponema sp.]